MLILAQGNSPSLGTQSRVVERVGYYERTGFGKCVVWVRYGCGSYPALPYSGKRPFQPYTVLGTQGN